MNKLMIAIAAIVLPVSSAMAAGTAACTSGTATNVTGDATKFIKNTMVIKCSANVNLNYEQGTVGVAVGANSIKGKNSFAGSSLGGAVAVSAPCSAACTPTMAETALQTMPIASL